MNILIAHWSWYPTGGDWTYVESVTRLYQQHGHTVIPFCMKDERNYPTPYDKYFIEKIDYKQVNKRSLSDGIKVISKTIYSVEAKRNLEKLLNTVKIDLAHLNVVNHYLTPSILKTLKKRNIPIIWTMNEYTPLCPDSTFLSHDQVCERCHNGKFYNCITHTCKKGSVAASAVAALENYIHHSLNFYRHADYYILPSRFSYEKFKQFNFFPEKLVHIYYSYNYAEIDELLRTPLPDAEEPYIAYTGRLEKIKGVYTLLKAMTALKHIKLIIVGDGTQEEELKTFAAENGLTQVTFAGKKSKRETLELVSKAKFTICPSEWYEVLGFTVAEAMALKKAVIGAAIGGIPEMVIDGETGLLFEPANAAQLAEKIKLLYNNEELCKKLGINAEKHIRNMINPEKHYNELRKLIPGL